MTLVAVMKEAEGAEPQELNLDRNSRDPRGR